MRYKVYYWSNDDVYDYEECYGEGTFDLNIPGIYGSVIQFGVCKLETDDKKEAERKCRQISESLRAFDCCAIWDDYEDYWFDC